MTVNLAEASIEDRADLPQIAPNSGNIARPLRRDGNRAPSRPPARVCSVRP